MRECIGAIAIWSKARPLTEVRAREARGITAKLKAAAGRDFVGSAGVKAATILPKTSVALERHRRRECENPYLDHHAHASARISDRSTVLSRRSARRRATPPNATHIAESRE